MRGGGGVPLPLFEHKYNCGFQVDGRMTERCLEIAIFQEWIKNKEGVIEIGAVTPYYFPNMINDVVDPSDENASIKASLFDIDLTGKNVLSISTIEHIGTGEYNLDHLKNESARDALKKIVSESASALITFPTGYNKTLDTFVCDADFEKLQKQYSLETYFYARRKKGNKFVQKDIKLAEKTPYGPQYANGVVVIEKK